MNYKDLPLVKKDALKPSDAIISNAEQIEQNQAETVNSAEQQNNALSTFMALDLGKSDSVNKADNKDSSAQMAEQSDENDKNAVSDERCKRLFGENCGDLIDCISKLNSYVFEYNEKAKSIPGAEDKGVDNDTHVGMLAQELAANPATAAAVKEDPLSGYLQVDTKELTMAEMAILTAMAKRIKALEEKVNGRY